MKTYVLLGILLVSEAGAMQQTATRYYGSQGQQNTSETHIPMPQQNRQKNYIVQTECGSFNRNNICCKRIGLTFKGASYRLACLKCNLIGIGLLTLVGLCVFAFGIVVGAGMMQNK